MSKEETIDKFADIYIEGISINYGKLSDKAQKQIKEAYAKGMRSGIILKELLTDKK